MHAPLLKVTGNDLIAARNHAATEDFGLFRQIIRKGMLWGWWTEEVAQRLQQFYRDFEAGLRPKLALQAPPQHGKSWSVTDFIAWVSGKNPDRKTIFGSYSDDLGVRTNLDLQRILTSLEYKSIFPGTIIEESNVVTISDRWKRNSSLIEFVGRNGSFRNTTISGQVNGMELHLGVIDDPIKGRAEAHSKTIRDKTWDWLTDDFLSRFAKDGALLMIMTRWHVDDPLGRLLERFPGVQVLRYPAIAERDEVHRFFNYKTKTWDRHIRRKGEALFPEHKPIDFLLERQKLMTKPSWESVYQQNPLVIGGGQFPIDKLKVLNIFDRSQVQHTIRYWDKAGSEDKEASFTAGARMHSMKDGTYVISHMVRGQWEALERESKIKTWADVDASEFASYEVYVEQEPGSGGKESAENTIRNLAGHRVYADKVTGEKEIRAEPLAAQVQGGNVRLVAGEWVGPFLDECEVYSPGAKWKDQIDAAAGAFNKLAAGTAYLTDYSKWL